MYFANRLGYDVHGRVPGSPFGVPESAWSALPANTISLAKYNDAADKVSGRSRIGIITFQEQVFGEMHELAVTESILKVALRHANEAKAEKIIRIHLRIGCLSDVSDEWLQRYFDFLSKDSIAEKAELSIEHVPAVFCCGDCGESFPFNLREMSNIQCPQCKGSKVTLISGREYFIKDIEVM